MKERGSTATAVPENDIGLGFASVQEPPPAEELDGQLDQARENLLTLRRQQEELERQKGELEELRRKQDEYTRGRAELLDKLNRGQLILEREQVQAQRLAELCGNSHEAFADYLEQLDSIHDDEWTAENLRPELSRALGIIENARLEYNRARTKLDCLNPAANQSPALVDDGEDKTADEWQEIARYAKLGAAASAPLIFSGSAWFIVWLLVR